MVALYQLSPGGKEFADRWLEKTDLNLEGRAMLLGAMGQTSREADALIRGDLEYLDWVVEGADREGYDLFPEWVIERLGRFGVGGWLAVPRLNQLRKHRDPWIRQWAGEALVRINPTAKTVPIYPR